MVRAVVFDLGETLIDETRIWAAWADWLQVPRPTFMATLSDYIERGEHHLNALRHFRQNFDLAEEEAAREEAGVPNVLLPEDLYPDAIRCLESLVDDGLLVGVAGNQPSRAIDFIGELGVELDLIAASEAWGLEKPSAEFFARIANELQLDPGEIAYVGDRVDNDIVPAADAGMVPIFIIRGPWARAQSKWPDAKRAAFTIHSLDELRGAMRSAR
jgi:FMN phosphatase YigB (HAD superfamily)